MIMGWGKNASAAKFPYHLITCVHSSHMTISDDGGEQGRS